MLDTNADKGISGARYDCIFMTTGVAMYLLMDCYHWSWSAVFENSISPDHSPSIDI